MIILEITSACVQIRVSCNGLIFPAHPSRGVTLCYLVWFPGQVGITQPAANFSSSQAMCDLARRNAYVQTQVLRPTCCVTVIDWYLFASHARKTSFAALFP